MSDQTGVMGEDPQLIFPFHIEVDRELKIVVLGRAIRRLCPDLRVGTALIDQVDLVDQIDLSEQVDLVDQVDLIVDGNRSVTFLKR